MLTKIVTTITLISADTTTKLVHSLHHAPLADKTVVCLQKTNDLRICNEPTKTKRFYTVSKNDINAVRDKFEIHKII